MSSNETDYEVGYGKPPVKTRFKKGQSGNPRGRPKAEALDLQPGNILQSFDNEEIQVNVNGRRMRMPKVEIYFRQLFNKAIRGDLTAARLLAKMSKQYFGPESKGSSETRFVVVPDHEFCTKTIDDTMTEPNYLANTRSIKKLFRTLKSRPGQQRPEVSVGSLFRKVATEPISFKIDGASVKIPLFQAYLREIYTMALNKNNGAARLLDQLRTKFPGNLPPGNSTTYLISETDAKL